MSPSPPPGGSTPFGGLPFSPFDLPPSDGPVNWAVAEGLARLVASGGEEEVEPAPADSDRLDAFVRVAELHLGEAGALDPATTGAPLRARSVSRREWAARTLDAYRPVLTALASALAVPAGGHEDEEDDAPVEDDPEGRAMAASTRGLVFGWMLGSLGRRAFGPYELPLPRPRAAELLLVPANLAEFAAEWRLPEDDLSLWACLTEVAHHAVLGRPHVRSRLESLLVTYVSAFEVEATAFEAELESIDPSDPTSFQSILGDPEAVLAAVGSPLQREVLPQIEALTAVVAGWVEHVVADIGGRLAGSATTVDEALRRRRVEASWGDRYAARLLGLGARQASAERGTAFVAGVLERAGEEALARLWTSERSLPTPAEVDAPGLWLARVAMEDGTQ
ncbi:MAG TPA: zinc-dependent metalloprotease [Acidimicrobiales bacterium]|nr:zinc-dependent metalloprotease [Acidimicrobiales bacterium]